MKNLKKEILEELNNLSFDSAEYHDPLVRVDDYTIEHLLALFEKEKEELIEEILRLNTKFIAAYGNADMLDEFTQQILDSLKGEKGINEKTCMS